MSSAKAIRSIARRSMHVISTANGAPSKRLQHLTQNAFAALAGQEQTPQLSSAQDIEMLLCNIGANCRVSSVTIQSLMQGAGTQAETEFKHCTLSGNEIIDLIATIRSI